jgi:hypothetical protein
MIGVTRRVAQNMVFTRFLGEKDCLTAAMTRMGSGFTPPTVITEAKTHLTAINHLMTQMEEMARLPRDAVVARDYRHLMEKSCCGRD